MFEGQAKKIDRRQRGKALMRKGDERVVAGVCAGIADYLDADAISVRVTAVVLLISTVGVIAIPYMVLAVLMPCDRCGNEPFDIDPTSIASDRYRQVIVKKGGAQSDRAVLADSGHVPPVPPREAVGMSRPREYWERIHELPVTAEQHHRRAPLVFAVALGMTVLFAVFPGLFMPDLPREGVIGFSPLFFVVLGTTLLTCFADKWSLVSRLCGLILCIELCLLLLPFTLGICPFESLYRLSGFSTAMWLVGFSLTLCGLLLRKPLLLVFAAIVIGAALGASFIDLNVIERLHDLAALSRHTMVSPMLVG